MGASAYAQAVAIARDEAKAIAATLQTDPITDITDVEIVATTIVYKRKGRTFHLVVHAMSDHNEEAP